jgi:hypothetical protein
LSSPDNNVFLAMACRELPGSDIEFAMNRLRSAD